jgi:hypothetical protein
MFKALTTLGLMALLIMGCTGLQPSYGRRRNHSKRHIGYLDRLHIRRSERNREFLHDNAQSLLFVGFPCPLFAHRSKAGAFPGRRFDPSMGMH